MRKLLTTTVLAFFTLTSFAQFSGSGSGTESDPYKIFYADQLSQVRNFLNQGGVYFKLMNDLNISDWLAENYPGQGWQPIGSTSEPFKGVFDGNGKTVSGFSITRTSADYVGLFASVSGATIKNFTLKGDIKGKAYVGSLFGSGSATVTNYTFVGTVTGTGDYIGGVSGSQGATSSTLTINATVKGASYTGGIYGAGSGLTSASFTGQVTGTSYTGGLEGQGSGTFSSCTVNAPVTGTSQYIGGLVGYAGGAITFQNNCTQTGNVTGTSYTGGLVGHSISSITANNCSQKGDITGMGNYVGGLIGSAGSSSTVSNYSHEGSVSGQQYTGGSVGWAKSITLNNSTQRGNIIGTTQTGGIIGYSQNGAVTLTSCYVEGDITGTTSVGGICGQIQNPSSSSISACSYWGNISGTSRLGGVVGDISVDSTTPIDFNATTTAGYKKYNGSNSGYSYSRTACFYKNSSPSLTAHTGGGYVNESSQTDIVQNYYISEWVKSTGIVYYMNVNGAQAPSEYPKVVYNNIMGTSTSNNQYVNILNCSAVGNINGTSSYIGGIVGKDMSGIIINYTASETKSIYYYKGDGLNTTTSLLTLKKYNLSNTFKHLTSLNHISLAI